MPGNEKIIILVVFAACYTLALSRKVKIAYASLGASAILLLLGILKPGDALFKAIKWDVLGIYWGFMMVSYVFMKSRMPELIANRILARVKVEKYAILSICGVTAFLSAFMENVGVVLMMAPVAIAVSRRVGCDMFTYLVSIAIGSNVVTTLMDNVPYTILMIPVSQSLADFLGVTAWPFLYGMLIGTGMGGNITPVGATANVFACGILEKNSQRVPLGSYLKLSIPFSLAAVATAPLPLATVLDVRGLDSDPTSAIRGRLSGLSKRSR